MKKFKVRIITKTGLHIGAGNASVEIGGMDNPVIKTTDGLPYIPGSSLKGKLRSLYEVNVLKSDLKEFDGKNYDEVSMFFGKAGNVKENLENLGATRFLFRDLMLKEMLDEDDKANGGAFSKNEIRTKKESGEAIFENKTEVSIDRKTGTVSSSGPRPLERVPAGTVFEGELIVRTFSKPDEKTEQDNLGKFGDNLSVLKELLENDYLGGQGTRGSGVVQIDFQEL